MTIRLLLILLLVNSFPAVSSDRIYKDVSWQAEESNFIATLSWAPSSAIKVYFQQVPSELLSIQLNAPYLLRETLEAKLYLMDSPIAAEGSRTLLQTLNRSQAVPVNQKEAHFDIGVDKLINRMGAGAWAVIELKTRSGVVHTVELPSIDFSRCLEQFNVLRNELPPIGWTAAQKTRVYFTPGSAQLTSAHQTGLNNLVEYLEKDTTVTGITIDAHTDIDGERLDNLTLSRQRASVVRDYLINAGVDETMLLAVRHHGERYPIPRGKARENRRVEIKLSRKQSS